MSEDSKIAQVRALVANDAWAISFQTFGQYRTALLNAIDLIDASEEARSGIEGRAAASLAKE